MGINSLGLTAAFAAFLSIWIGHVSVRKFETVAVNLWKPMVTAFLLGICMEIAATRIADRGLSMSFGIIGFSLLWDVLELNRQARRVMAGHAPANPNNPRHAAILGAPGTKAVTYDPLARSTYDDDTTDAVTNYVRDGKLP